MEARSYRRELQRHLETLGQLDQVLMVNIKAVVKKVTTERDSLKVENADLQRQYGNLFYIFSFYNSVAVNIVLLFFICYFCLAEMVEMCNNLAKLPFCEHTKTSSEETPIKSDASTSLSTPVKSSLSTPGKSSLSTPIKPVASTSSTPTLSHQASPSMVEKFRKLVIVRNNLMSRIAELEKENGWCHCFLFFCLASFF